MVNQAFRAAYSLTKQVNLKRKYGLSKLLLGLSDYFFYFYCLDFGLFSTQKIVEF